MCRSEGEIMQNNPIIQEIDDHIAENNLESLDKLMLRVMKYNYAKSIQIQEDVEKSCKRMEKHIDNKDIHTPKGVLLRGKVIAWAVFIVILVSTIICYLPDKVAVLFTP